MNRSTKTVLFAVGGAAVVNFALAYMTSAAKTGRQPGQNKLLDLNDSLLRFNPLALLLGGGAAGSTMVGAPQTFAPLPAPIVTDTSGGTTTYFGGG